MAVLSTRSLVGVPRGPRDRPTEKGKKHQARQAIRTKMAGDAPHPLRFIALAVLVVQNSSLALVMNIATRKKFFKTTANFYSELLKFGTCMAMIQREVSMIACI